MAKEKKQKKEASYETQPDSDTHQHFTSTEDMVARVSYVGGEKHGIAERTEDKDHDEEE